MSKNPLFSRDICWDGFGQVFSAPIETDAAPQHEHPRLTKLPHWPNETIAVLCTVDEAPYAIPVTAPVRVGDRKILLSLNDCRGSLARLQKNPQVALLILSAGDLAFTVRGRAFVVDTTIAPPSEFVAVAIEAEAIDDHRAARKGDHVRRRHRLGSRERAAFAPGPSRRTGGNRRGTAAPSIGVLIAPGQVLPRGAIAGGTGITVPLQQRNCRRSSVRPNRSIARSHRFRSSTSNVGQAKQSATSQRRSDAAYISTVAAQIPRSVDKKECRP